MSDKLTALADYTAVVITNSPWDEPPRIRHQLTRQLARFGQVNYVELPSDWRSPRVTSTERISSALRVVRLGNPQRLPRRVALHFRPVQSLLHRGFACALEEALSDVPPSRRIVVNFDYAFGEILAPRHGTLGVYVCNDDFQLFVPGPWAKRCVSLAEQRTARAADACFAVSETLRQRLSKLNPVTRLLLPGHEFDLTWPLPPIRRDGFARAAFMGYIDDRLDFEALTALVDAGVLLELIGPVATQSEAFRKLRDRRGVYLAGPVTGAALQARLQAMDVLLMPYDLRRYGGQQVVTAPNKLFAYIASGRPVIASAMPNLLTFAPGLVYTARDPGEFVAAVMRARAEDSCAFQQSRRAVAAANTWHRRGDEFRAELEGLLSQRRR